MLFVQKKSTEEVYDNNYKNTIVFTIQDRDNKVNIISGILEKVPTLHYRYNLQDPDIQDEISDATERAYHKIYDKINTDLKILKSMNSIEIYEYFMKFRKKHPKHNIVLWFPKKDLMMMNSINQTENTKNIEKWKSFLELQRAINH